MGRAAGMLQLGAVMRAPELGAIGGAVGARGRRHERWSSGPAARSPRLEAAMCPFTAVSLQGQSFLPVKAASADGEARAAAR